MSRTENNISGAAKLLGISRPTLYDLLKQYQLSDLTRSRHSPVAGPSACWHIAPATGECV